MKERTAIASVENLETEIASVRKAQRIFATFSQEKVDRIFLAVALLWTQLK